MYFRRPYFLPCWSFVSFVFDQMSEAMHVHETGTKPAKRQNRKGKRLQIIYAPLLRVFSHVSVANKAKNERMRRLVIENVEYI